MKLQTYAAKLEALLDGLTLRYYFLAVPQYHAAELVTYGADRVLLHPRAVRLANG